MRAERISARYRPSQINIAQMFAFVKLLRRQFAPALSRPGLPACLGLDGRRYNGRPQGMTTARRTRLLPGGPTPFMAWGAAARHTGPAPPRSPQRGRRGREGRRGEPRSFLLHCWRCVALRPWHAAQPKAPGARMRQEAAARPLAPPGRSRTAPKPEGQRLGGPGDPHYAHRPLRSFITSAACSACDSRSNGRGLCGRCRPRRAKPAHGRQL